ncbi:hypothetical protein [Acidovorax sp. A1169]|uniref:hypothetical protein n=1 Tax=Acidovorax sp. A1169 TaxID=3059524 RepID=UPI002737A1E5|nr:hypothetical protein [Acidovorax sp. A1169]MDP4076702.1 hypothetical protein [Acidovorax sp. A1169]
MKPYITPEMNLAGKKVYKFQLESPVSDLWSHLKRGVKLLFYWLPEGHTLQCAWQLIFVFDNGMALEFSSACTVVVGWDEVGSLNVSAKITEGKGSPAGACNIFSEFTVREIERVVYEDDEIVVQTGIVFVGEEGDEIYVCSGISPGSVSVRAPFYIYEDFKPQFSLSQCIRQPI